MRFPKSKKEVNELSNVPQIPDAFDARHPRTIEKMQRQTLLVYDVKN